MNRDINSILEDLYKIDPSFKKNEQQLKKMIEDLLLSKPDTKFDEQFASVLRTELMDKQVQNQSVPSPYTSSAMSSLSVRSLFNVLNIHKVGYGFAGALVAFIVLLPFLNTIDNSTGLTLNQIVNNKGEEAFGPLAFTENARSDVSAFGSAQSMATEDGVGMGSNVPGVAQVSPERMVAPYQPEVIRYTYQGESFTLSETEGDVFVRTKGEEAGRQIASLLSEADFSLVDLKSFDDLKARQLELSEDRPFGYTLSVNFNEGVLHIMPNWQNWNSVDTERIMMPDDAALVAMTDSFLEKYGISTESYASPVVDRRQLELWGATSGESSASSLILPHDMSQISVVYPLKLEDKKIYDESGAVYGLQVNVNLRENKVVAVNNLTSQVYESSSYKLETDPAKVLSYITSSDVVPSQGSVIKEIKLGTPTRVLMKYNSYNGNGVSNEMYIPALKFPVIKQDVTPYYQDVVLVPLVKEILDSRNSAMPESEIQPLWRNN